MNLVLRGVIIYLFLLIVFRLMGKRSLSETTTFDLVLLLIISEVTQQALVGEDYSLTAAMVLIVTLISFDLVFTLLKTKFKFFGKLAEGSPLIIVDHGKPLLSRMQKCHVDEDDIMEAARLSFGLEKLEEIKYAIL
jgi:uncharacterized membrane protein YcaP (DUF421 family)